MRGGYRIRQDLAYVHYFSSEKSQHKDLFTRCTPMNVRDVHVITISFDVFELRLDTKILEQRIRSIVESKLNEAGVYSQNGNWRDNVQLSHRYVLDAILLRAGK